MCARPRTLALLALPASQALFAASIVVDLGEYPSAESAAADRGRVSWRDGDHAVSTRFSSSHASAEDALAATLAAEALPRFREALETP